MNYDDIRIIVERKLRDIPDTDPVDVQRLRRAIGNAIMSAIEEYDKQKELNP